VNTQSLLELVTRRVPGYDESEYLSEINQAYSDVWEKIVSLDDTYFTDKKILTVTTASADFDFLYNTGTLYSGSAIPKLHQIIRVRVLAPNTDSWFAARAVHFNDPDFVSQQQGNTPTNQLFGPYLYVVYGKGKIEFGRPLEVATQIEITYEYGYFDLTKVTDGTVSSSAAIVTGTSSHFTTLLPPDYVGQLPGTDIDLDIDAEIIVAGKTYQVKSVASDTSLTLRVTPGTAFSTSAYVLAAVPVFPETVHNTIADLATRNMFSTPADDARFQTWAAITAEAMEQLARNLMKRQRQTNARKQRFPFGAIRRGRYR
jgi:hypothetical protein